MYIPFKLLAFTATTLWLTLAGCAALADLADGDSESYEIRTGDALHEQIIQDIPDVLEDNGFSIYRLEHRPGQRTRHLMETEWHHRDLFEDEKQGDVVRARTLIKVNSTDTGRRSAGGERDLFGVHVVVLNEHQSPGGIWRSVEPSEQTREWIDGIIEEIDEITQ